MQRPWVFLPVLVGLAISGPAEANGPVLHVQIPSDVESDYTMGATGPGDLPAAVETRNGLVRSPDARRPPSANEAGYGNNATGDANAEGSTFTADRNTRRPDVSHYDEPFRPATAPFKRVWTYDAVDEGYRLYVKQPRQDGLKVGGSYEGEERFFADIVINGRASGPVRIPSVAAGAHVLRAHLASGQRDLPFALMHDGADNWFVLASGSGSDPVRARLVMEVSAPRDSFGGEYGTPSWSDLPPVDRLPPNVAAAAKQVAAHIGVSRAMSPREVVRKLVSYHRSFVESDEPPAAQGSVYLDLALSQKGVCRHRAFSFLITALGLGLPARMVLNEAHAWVEIHDGRLWRRMDLGGAGRTTEDSTSDGPVYDPPPDPFQWPSGATPGDALAPARASSGGGSGSSQGAASSSSAKGSSSSNMSSASGAANASASAGAPPDAPHGSDEKDDRPRSTVTLTVGDADARRGGALRIGGNVRADGEACPNVVVDIVLRDGAHTKNGRTTEVQVGSLATDAQGAYAGSLVVPSSVPVGDYDVIARTSGNMRCGRSP